MDGRDKSSFTEKLARLNAEYAAKLPERVAAIERHLQAYLDRGGAGHLDEAFRAVHSLAGSASTFGQEEAGRVAEALKIALQSRREPDAPLPRVNDQGLARLMLALKASVLPGKKS